MAKTSLHAHTAVARLPGVSYAFLLDKLQDASASITRGHGCEFTVISGYNWQNGTS